MLEELKPCPFENVVKDIGHNVYYQPEIEQVVCSCGATGPMMAGTQESAEKGWNTRPETKPLTVEQLMKDICFACRLPLPDMELARIANYLVGKYAALPSEQRPMTEAEMIWALAPLGTVQAGWYNSTLSFWSAAELMDGYDVDGIEWVKKPEQAVRTDPQEPQ